jgi:uncharacterized protein involved in exopolysaccharide biosynthesis
MRLRHNTPRDRLEHLLDYVRRAFRYWWVTVGLIVVGGVLSFLYARRAPQVFQSQAVLVYQPKIQSVVLSGRDQETVQRNIGDRYRELLLSRQNLTTIVSDPKISPFPDAVKNDTVEEAVESLRTAIQFDSRGVNTFRITYSDGDRKRAQQVTARLTDLLIAAETNLRSGAAQRTLAFAQQQKKDADADLQKLDRDLSAFLNQHPEFAQVDQPGAAEGAAIRASQKDKPHDTGNPRLLALERQADRLRTILATPEGVTPPPPVPVPHVKTPDQIAAQQQIDEAQREVTQAKRHLDDMLHKYNDGYPDVVNARGALKDAQGRLDAAIAAMPPDQDTVPDVIAPSGKIDRDKLAKDLADLDKRIEAEKARTQAAQPSSDEASKQADAIVAIETAYKDLKRRVDEQRENVGNLAGAENRAKIAASQQSSEDDANLAVVDPAYEPVAPFGKGKRVIVMVGLVLFTGLGCALALGLAIIDDRLYRRGDIEKLDLAPVLAVIPRANARRGRA